MLTYNSFKGGANEDLRFQRIHLRGETSYGSQGDIVGSCAGAGRSGSPGRERRCSGVGRTGRGERK